MEDDLQGIQHQWKMTFSSWTSSEIVGNRLNLLCNICRSNSVKLKIFVLSSEKMEDDLQQDNKLVSLLFFLTKVIHLFVQI